MNEVQIEIGFTNLPFIYYSSLMFSISVENYMKFLKTLFMVMFFALVTFAQEETSKAGFGFDFGTRIWYPTEVNDFQEYKWEEMKSGYYTVSEMGSEKMFTGFSFRLRGAILPVKPLMIEPYADLFWAGKYLTVNSSGNWTNFLDYTGGVNIFGRLNSEKTVSFKMGAGIYVGYSQFMDSEWDISLSGISKGLNGLAGIDITFKKIMVTITFKVPVGYTDLELDDVGDITETDYPFGKIPERVMHVGFEIRPGVIFLF